MKPLYFLFLIIPFYISSTWACTHYLKGVNEENSETVQVAMEEITKAKVYFNEASGKIHFTSRRAVGSSEVTHALRKHGIQNVTLKQPEQKTVLHDR